MLTLDMWQFAPEASVALMASHTVASTSARSYTDCGSALSGGFSSAVTAKRPKRSTRSSRDPDLIDPCVATTRPPDHSTTRPPDYSLQPAGSFCAIPVRSLIHADVPDSWRLSGGSTVRMSLP